MNAVAVKLSDYDWTRSRFYGTQRRGFHAVLGTEQADHLKGINFNITGADYETIAVACEYAPIKYLGLNPKACGWFPFSTDFADFKQPDFLCCEVRSVTALTNGLVVKTKDVEAGAILIKTHVPNARVEDGELKHDGTVLLLGWVYAEEAWNEGYRHHKDRNARRYLDELRPMDELAPELTKLGYLAGMEVAA
ncbi:hypothetical protein OHB41_33165 [Streptomyces sp. NBC_01571]|uniref:hypothetical protein n=1 Tax=Streptomyces sp. NBC_01571 TaxID=2975883 RepID=UPI002253CF7A|nr:hypothetical protein [Streptomyces sp. NBC_01571]MCX4577952.1 hypothetical protein [Streptomyces sp. NBC_01571]